MPFADLTNFSANPTVQDFGNVLTVRDMCRYVESKVGAA
jgi:acyl carrier protein